MAARGIGYLELLNTKFSKYGAGSFEPTTRRLPVL